MTLNEQTVEPFLEQHPFLDGQGQAIGNAVFEADLFAAALVDDIGDSRAVAINTANDPRLKPNPFLFPFCLSRIRARQDPENYVVPGCIGPLYDSLKAREGAGESTYIRCFAAKNDADGRLGSIVLMAIGRDVQPVFAASFLTDASGSFIFPRGLSDAIIISDNSVELGDGDAVQLSAPCIIEGEEIYFNGSILQINAPIGTRLGNEGRSGLDVVLIARSVRDEKVRRAPRIVPNVNLSLYWEGCKRFPWLGYDLKVEPAPPDIEKARLALRILVLSFRAHSKGALARYEDKIEHQRITKGDVGESIREKLLQDGVLQKKGSFYFLDPDKLGQLVGTSYQDIRKRKFSAQCDGYLRRIVAGLNA